MAKTKTETSKIADRRVMRSLASGSRLTLPSTIASHAGHAKASSQTSAPHEGQNPVSEENFSMSSVEGSSCIQLQCRSLVPSYASTRLVVVVSRGPSAEF